MTTDQSATDRARDAASSAGSASQHVAGVAADEAKSVAAETKEQVRGLADQARTEIGTHVDDQTRQGKDRLASTLGTFGDDLGEMAESGSGLAAQVAHELAERAQALGRHLDGREPSELLDDVRRFARERPGTFLLGSLGAGIVAGRLLRGTKDAVDAADGTAATDTGPAAEAISTEPAPRLDDEHLVPPLAGDVPPTTGYSAPPAGTGLAAQDPLS